MQQSELDSIIASSKDNKDSKTTLYRKELFKKGSYCLGHDILFHNEGGKGCPLCAIDKGDLVENYNNLKIDYAEALFDLQRRRHI